MMMPANFSAVSENEMTYVMGGSVADYLAPAMGAAQWQNFHKNLITIVGNKYVQGFLDNTVGAVFSGTWTPGAQKFGYGALGVVNSILNVAGNLAAIYNLGFGTAKNIVNENKFGF